MKIKANRFRVGDTLLERIKRQPPQETGGTTRDAVEAEGLTDRQLRMAERVAEKHGITAQDPIDAVVQLRQAGIDPFQKINIRDLVSGAAASEPTADASGAGVPQKTTGNQLPNKIIPGQVPAPAPEKQSAFRVDEIADIQAQIAARRKKNIRRLLRRLAVFIVLPTLLVGYYYYNIATPLYSTTAKFFILKADGSSGGAAGGLLSGTQFATSQDAFAVQQYLTSKEAMQRLDSDVGFKDHFSHRRIDFITRLSPDASLEEAYKTYQRHVVIGFDPTEGVIRMEVTAANPQLSAAFAKALIRYAEQRVDSLSRRKREDQVRNARETLEKARQDRIIAQQNLVRLQQEGAVLDPEGRIAALRSQINNVEVMLQEKNLQLQALLDNTRPNMAKVEGAQGDVRRLNALLAELEAEMTAASNGEGSLAELASRIQLAQGDLVTRDLMLQSALEQFQQTNRDANSQARYLTTAEAPVVPEDPAYPRKFESTLLAFMVFGGMYLLLSITASVLREQISG